MESLGDILRRIRTQEFIEGDRYAIEGNVVDESKAEVCQICNGAGWVSKRVSLGHPDFGEAFPCRCQGLNQNDRAESLLRFSNLGHFSRITLADTQNASVLGEASADRLFRSAFEAAVDFAENPSGWLVFNGPSGSGKTHLAVAIANRCIELGHTTYFIAASDLLDHLRSTYAPDNSVTYDDLFEQVRNVPLLVLDDLNPQTTTPWAQEKLFQIISHRFNLELPTIFTVRGPLERLGEALNTRLNGSSGFSKVFLLGNHHARIARRLGAPSEDMKRRMTLDRFESQGAPMETRAGKESLAAAKRAAEEFISTPDGWLFLKGPRGRGKTHLAVAIASECEKQGLLVYYTFIPSLLDNLRYAFRADSQIGHEELLEQVKSAPLLILDDLDTHIGSEWAEDKLYQILVHRYDLRLPTVITSVYEVNEFIEYLPRVGSRLVDSEFVKYVPIMALNFRDQRRRGPST